MNDDPTHMNSTILPIVEPLAPALDDTHYDFPGVLKRNNVSIPPLSLATLQVNVGKLCNQACRHCHVDAGPKRTEMMDLRTAEQVIRVLEAEPGIGVLDITGGAPELNPNFRYLVESAHVLGKHVMVRHNLTVQIDPHPVTGESMEWLPEYFAENNVEVVSSLPYYAEYFTDRQRGRGVFNKSIEALRRLNALGYGVEGWGLPINLVYNPVGTFLPGGQEALEADFKRELRAKFGVVFNNLYTITNMPIHRFRDDLIRHGGYEAYMEKLVTAFNPAAAGGVMCRTQINVDWDGRLSDCDFNQMLDLPVVSTAPQTIFDFNYNRLLARSIVFRDHCFGCTAGAGSSCGGATA